MTDKLKKSKTDENTRWSGRYEGKPKHSWKFWKRWGNKLARRLRKNHD